ncbi:MAG: DUF4265 domain-containing protein [Polyangiaceae bacterium]
MTVPSPRYVKVLLEIEGTSGAREAESVWAVEEEGGYRLDNIPFYARGFACGDLVSAAPDPDGTLRCTGLLAASGHSTLRLWFSDENHVQAVRDQLRMSGCASELDLPRLVAVDVPPSISYSTIRSYLDEKEGAGVLEYEEACLGQ